MEVLALILGVPLGVFASLAAWWILFHYLRPQIEFSTEISKLADRHAKSGAKYRIKIRNSGRRTAVELNIVCRFIAGKVLPGTPETDSIVKINISSESIPYVLNDSKDKIIRIYPERTKAFCKKYFPGSIRVPAVIGSLQLDDLFLLENSYLEIIVFATDEFSGARKMFASVNYTGFNIVAGPFAKGELNVIPE